VSVLGPLQNASEVASALPRRPTTRARTHALRCPLLNGGLVHKSSVAMDGFVAEALQLEIDFISQEDDEEGKGLGAHCLPTSASRLAGGTFPVRAPSPAKLELPEWLGDGPLTDLTSDLETSEPECSIPRRSKQLTASEGCLESCAPPEPYCPGSPLPRKARRGKRGRGRGELSPKAMDLEPPVCVALPPKVHQDRHNDDRRARKAEPDRTLRPPNAAVVEAALRAPSEPTAFSYDDLNRTSTGYTARHEDEHCKQHYSLTDLLSQGFRLVNWLGL
jgi:hypothetical protein